MTMMSLVVPRTGKYILKMTYKPTVKNSVTKLEFTQTKN